MLVGLMGAGKTTVGQRCAEALERDFIDTDDLVTVTVGMTVPEIFDRFGETRFRELERDAVRDACASPVPVVIACGGGAVLDPDNCRRLRETGFVVWLRASASALSARVGDGISRPLLRDGKLATLERLAELRQPAYERAADAVVDTDGWSIYAVEIAVLEEFRAWNA